MANVTHHGHESVDMDMRRGHETWPRCQAARSAHARAGTSGAAVKIFTREDLAVLDLLERPVYVFDVERIGLWWANQAAVEFWGAADRDELTARDFGADLSAASVQRIADNLRRVERGERVIEEWTCYPRGVPVPTRMSLSAIAIESGRLAILTELEPLAPDALGRADLRGVEALRHLPVAVCEFDQSGQVIFQNPEALRVFGPSTGLLSLLPRRFADRVEGERILREATRGEWVEIQAPLETLGGPRWFQVSLIQSTDPVHGGPIILFTARDVSEHRSDREHLQHAKEAAEAASRAKSSFMASLTHELRAPVSSLLGAGELLGGTELDSDQRDHLQRMRASARSLLALIDDVVDLSRLEAGRMDVFDLPLDLHAFLAEVTDAIGARVRGQGLSFIVHRDQDLPRALRGDPQRLRQLLVRLVDGALARTGAGAITLRATRAPAHGRWREDVWLRVEIADTGAGLPPERLERMFDTGPRSALGVPDEDGMGQAICRLLAERMGGAIGAESMPDGGNRFWVDLPLRLDGRAHTLELGEDGDARRILVVEDNPVNQVLVRTVLKKLGHRATVAGNGRDALRALDDEDFDLVLMDIQMPEMDGVEATRAIRARGLSAEQLPIIALTANLSAETRVVYLHAGMNECMGKPFRVGELAAMIERWTATRAA
jgi:signal transduction histidine kinase/ActR/RegA family two-component response regulator